MVSSSVDQLKVAGPLGGSRCRARGQAGGGTSTGARGSSVSQCGLWEKGLCDGWVRLVVINDYELVVAGGAAMLNHLPSGCRAALRKRLPTQTRTTATTNPAAANGKL